MMNKSKPSLRLNIAALGVLQIANYIIPMTTLPYLTRTLGAESFGKVAFVQALMTYFVLLTDYGFSLSATREISAHRDDRGLITKIFSANWASQWIILFVALSLLTTIIFFIPSLRSDADIYFAGSLILIGNVLFPLWLLQGLERMREVAAIQMTARLITLPLVFTLIQSKEDVFLTIMITSSATLLAGVISLCWIRWSRVIDFRPPEAQAIKYAIKSGFTLFLSKVSISAYTNLTPLVLGAVAGPLALAHFNISDKARGAAQSFLGPVSQALFPRMSHLFKSDILVANDLLKKSIVFIVPLATLVSFSLWVSADWIVLFLAGADFSQAVPVLLWLAPLPLVIGLSNILGIQIMLPNHMNRLFNNILFAAGILSLTMIWPMTKNFGAIGAAQTLLATEIFVTVTMGIILYRKGYLFLFRNNQ